MLAGAPFTSPRRGPSPGSDHSSVRRQVTRRGIAVTTPDNTGVSGFLSGHVRGQVENSVYSGPGVGGQVDVPVAAPDDPRRRAGPVGEDLQRLAARFEEVREQAGGLPQGYVGQSTTMYCTSAISDGSISSRARISRSYRLTAATNASE